MEFPLGVPPNADAGGSEEKVKCRGYGQSDLGKRDLERHFGPVSSQLRTVPPGFRSSQRPEDCRSSPQSPDLKLLPGGRRHFQRICPAWRTIFPATSRSRRRKVVA